MQNIYKILASQYDPLGFLLPYATWAKMLVRQLWNSGVLEVRNWTGLSVLPPGQFYLPNGYPPSLDKTILWTIQPMAYPVERP